MASKIILTGATGNAGSAILTEALASPHISHVTVLSRRPPLEPNSSHPKLTTIIIPSEKYPKGFDGDALDPNLVAELKATGATVCIWALGISQMKVSKEEYVKVTHDYALTAARAFSSFSTSPEQPFRLVFVSGEGADQTETSRTLFGRIKGRTEKELAALESDTFKVVSVRPAMIIPADNHRKYLSYLEKLGTSSIVSGAIGYLAPNMVIPSSDLAKACLRLAGGPSLGQNPQGWERRTREGWMGNGVLRELAGETYQGGRPA